MKLLGLQSVEGGVGILLPSGRQILLALPDDRDLAAAELGYRILELLDDPTIPHAHRPPIDVGYVVQEDPPDEGPFAALNAGIEFSSVVRYRFAQDWRSKHGDLTSDHPRRGS